MLYTKIVIDRLPEIIKAVFMNWPRYPFWNPFITSLSLFKGSIDHPKARGFIFVFNGKNLAHFTFNY
jgi:hypothetical protein